MFSLDSTLTRSTMSTPFGQREPQWSMEHRVIESPTPVVNRFFATQRDCVRSLAAETGSMPRRETFRNEAFVNSFGSSTQNSVRPPTGSQQMRPSTSLGSLSRPAPTNIAWVRAQPATQRISSLSGGFGFGPNQRVEHLRRSPGSSDARSSIGFAPLGYPRGRLRLSESRSATELHQLRPATRAGTTAGLSIFQATRSSAGGVVY